MNGVTGTPFSLLAGERMIGETETALIVKGTVPGDFRFQVFMNQFPPSP
jgi:hypothetical protein